jgi:hypothetical protein
MSYPIYILDDDSILFIKKDLNHVDFWNSHVAKIVAKLYHLPISKLINIPYCQRRARVVGKKLFCGEKINDQLLQKIKNVLNKPNLVIVYDQHETTLPYDKMILNSLKS